MQVGGTLYLANSNYIVSCASLQDVIGYTLAQPKICGIYLHMLITPSGPCTSNQCVRKYRICQATTTNVMVICSESF